MKDSRQRYIPIDVPHPASKISNEALDEFIAIYKKEFKEDITRPKAQQMASDLLQLYTLVSRKLPRQSDAV
jgi:hypothetical protein